MSFIHLHRHETNSSQLIVTRQPHCIKSALTFGCVQRIPIHETHKWDIVHYALLSTSDYVPILLGASWQDDSNQDVKGLQNNVKMEGDLPCRVSRAMYRFLPCEGEERPRCSKMHPCPRS